VAKRVLVADDEEHIRQLIRIACRQLVERGEITLAEAGDGESALHLAREAPPDLILLDINMPRLSGLECCRQLRADPGFPTIPIVLLTAYGTSEMELAAQEAGATGVIIKPFRPRHLIRAIEQLLGESPASLSPLDGVPAPLATPAVTSQLLAYADDLDLSLTELQAAHRQLRVAYLATVQALSTALETRDVETAGHCTRVAAFTVRLGQEVGYPSEEMLVLQFGATLHDVGKIGVPDAILRKPGSLTDEEWQIMRRHPELGELMLREIEFLRSAVAIVIAHHERWDGRGYPLGLEREAIPLGARVFVIADSLDAMLSDRPYRRARPWEEAVAEIVGGRGTQFDPCLVDTFLRHSDSLRPLLDHPVAP
jgi:response regulator RpfG family c-di-GMP phosphodiesterase